MDGSDGSRVAEGRRLMLSAAGILDHARQSISPKQAKVSPPGAEERRTCMRRGNDSRLETCFARSRQDEAPWHQSAGKALRRVKA